MPLFVTFQYRKRPKKALFLCKGLHLLENFPDIHTFVKSYYMLNTNLTLQMQLDNCHQRIDQCIDVIKQLTGVTPDHFTFTFSIGRAVITEFEIGIDESNFAMSFFMAWHQFYSKKLLKLRSEMSLTG